LCGLGFAIFARRRRLIGCHSFELHHHVSWQSDGGLPWQRYAEPIPHLLADSGSTEKVDLIVVQTDWTGHENSLIC
jgi:hypothetical protein